MATNAEIARTLMRMRTLMELCGETFYKFMAYERAAETLGNAPPVADLIASGQLTKLPGIGKSIAATIEEIVRTGTCEQFESLQKRYPPTIFEVLDVPGIGIKTAATLHDQLGIGSLADLERALDDGSIAALPRTGKKSIENIRRGILAYRGRQHRTPLAKALNIAREAVTYLARGPAAERLGFAGSLRRAEATVGDIDLVCTSDAAAAVIEHFVRWDRARAVLAEGPTKGSIWLEDGLQIDLRVLPDHLYGNLLQHFTGSREHNIQLREHAVRKSLRVSENGILNLENGEVFTTREESEVYGALGMQYIPPEMRLGIGEVDLALRGEIPHLVDLPDIRGDFHMHTTWSDGRGSLDQMVEAAAARGYEWHATSDHSQGRGAIGLRAEQLREQRERIREIGDRYHIRTLHGSEVDIRADGSMDFPDDVLAELDVVIGSVHSSFTQSREEMTARIIRACENPYVSIIGHPTGRLLDSRPSSEYDYDAVFAAAVRTGTAMEIDGHANRLDLPANLIRRAATFGVTFTTDSDAHDATQLSNVELAVSQARCAALTPDRILNTRSLDDVLAFFAAKRNRAAVR